MGEIVNLNKYRKDRAKKREQRKSAESRVRHGRSHGERREAMHDEKRRNQELDGKSIDPGGPDENPPAAG